MRQLGWTALLFIMACGGDSTTIDGGDDSGGRVDGGGRDSGPGIDSGPDVDSGPGVDSGPDMDGGPTDGGPTDGGPTDGGSTDAGPPVDAGPCTDPPPTPDRPAATACSPCRPDFPPPPPLGVACDEHSDCTDGANGRCVLGMIGPFCSYDECFTDDDCAAGEVCSCDGALVGGGNACVPANCRTNADCPSAACAPSYTCLLGGPPGGWYCRTPSVDMCATDFDCSGMPGGRCAHNDTTMQWECEYSICVF